MALSRNSKIKEAWKHPVGHDMLQQLSVQMGRSERWAENPIIANMPLKTLDRLAGGPGFVDTLLEMAAFEVDRPAIPLAEHSTWWKEAVFYQVYLPSFMDSDHDGVGDLGGVIQRLPYLAQLGVDALWLSPFCNLPMGMAEECGFQDILEDLGSMEDLEALTQAAHARGMRVVMELDIAYTGENHPWFQMALQPEGQKKRAYYIVQKGNAEKPPNNWCGDAAPAWQWYPQIGAWVLALHSRGQLDLNWDNAELRTEIVSIFGYWLEKGIDGFCLGPVNMISKAGFEDGRPLAGNGTAMPCGYEKYTYGPALHRYLRQLRSGLPLHDELLLAGEVRGIGTETAKLFTDEERHELNLVLDASHLAAKPGRVRKGKVLREEGLVTLQELKSYYLRWMKQFGSEQWMALFFENADTPRMISRIGASPIYRAILAKLLGTMLMTLRGTPLLYQGEELGLVNTRFSSVLELRDGETLNQYHEWLEQSGEAAAFKKVLALTADHARVPMPWSAGPRGGFTGAEPWIRLPDGIEYLNAASQIEDGNSVLRHYQKLIALRKKNACLVYGSFNPVFIKNKRVFCYFRISEGDKWYVEMNLTEKEVPRPGRILRSMKLVLSNYDALARTLRPYEANLYHCE